MKKRKQNIPRAIPLPEAIDGEEWAIRESPMRSARIGHKLGTTEHEMHVPLGTDAVARLIRLHEMMHVKITPRGWDRDEGLPGDLVNLCEDSRVHGHMNRLGFSTSGFQGVISDFELGEMSQEGHDSQIAALGAALYRTGEYTRLENKITEDDDEERAEHRLKVLDFGRSLAEYRMNDAYELPGYDHTLQMVRDIINVFGDPRDPEDEQMLPDGMLGYMVEAPEMDEQTGRPIINAGNGPWGEMILEEPPLPLHLPGAMKGKRRKRPDRRGRRLHRVGRLFHDGMVFANKPPVKGGGAVLIDTSGSMSLTAEEVLQLCLTYPAGVIGAYSGDGGSGYLRVIARNGRRVPDDQISPPGGGNLVDGPALEWLAKQPGPRYWISDAGVEGGAVGLRYCMDVCKRANITRVDDAWEIVGKEM